MKYPGAMVTGITRSREEEQLLIRIGRLQMGKGDGECTWRGGGGKRKLDRHSINTGQRE